METLASRVARDGALAEIDAVGWVIRIARSVEAIHDRGHVHGRLSADGLLIAAAPCTSEGRLVPFAELPENVAYHSPERERGEGGSQPDDTWAVAVTLYLALSGSLPFLGGSDAEVRLKIKTAAAPPLAVFDVGDDALQGIVDRALARDRAQRITTLAELRHELEAWRSGPQTIAAYLASLPPLAGDEEPDEVTMMLKPGFADAVRKILDIDPPTEPRSSSKPSSHPGPAAGISSSPPAKPSSSIPPGPAGPISSPRPPGLPKPANLSKTVALVASARLSKTLPLPVSAPAHDLPRSPGKPGSAPIPSEPPPAPSPPEPPASAPVSSVASVPRPLAAPPKRRSKTGLVVVCMTLLVAGLAAGFVWVRRQKLLPALALLAAPRATMEAPVPRPTESAPPAEAPQSSASAAPASSSAAPPPTDLAACVPPLFPPESFGSPADFAFICSETDPMKGGAAVRGALVRAHRSVSDAMKEWAVLGWYEMAAFSVIRARCCPAAPPLKLPEAHGCAPVAEALAGIDAAAMATTDPGDKALKKAVDSYTDDVHCIVRSGMATRFGRVGYPLGGEDTMFTRVLTRMVAAKR